MKVPLAPEGTTPFIEVKSAPLEPFPELAVFVAL
jgi:hypothetical protein